MQEYNFKINDFEGPLDLMLHLVKEKKMEILDIDVAIITKQYVDFVHSMQTQNLEVASEYLTMAAYLVEVKSKALLPNEKVNIDGEFVEDERSKLIRRLLEYKKYKDVKDKFRALADARRNYFTKDPESLKQFKKEVDLTEIPEKIDIDALANSLLKMYDRIEETMPLDTSMVREEISVEDRVMEIEEILARKNGCFNFMDLFETRLNKLYFVITLIAILDMAKYGKLKVVQDEKYDEIFIEMR